MRRFGLLAATAAATTTLTGACGSVRTTLPASVAAAPPLASVVLPTTTVDPGPVTTASAYRSPGEQHPLAGGTLAASYPRVGVRPPPGVAPAPAGQAWAVLNVRFCAAAGGTLDPALLEPSRFQVEVPGQGYVGPAPDAPALAKAPLAAGTAVPPGTCLVGSIAYLVGGEGHIESITYDRGDGLLRWAT
ncbi:MAG: hypothetical protein ABIS47_03785 [Acidimicrobiales bacterium]